MLTIRDHDLSLKVPFNQCKIQFNVKRVFLHFWREWKIIVYYELFPVNQTLHSKLLYSSQPSKFTREIDHKLSQLTNIQGISVLFRVWLGDTFRLENRNVISRKILDLMLINGLKVQSPPLPELLNSPQDLQNSLLEKNVYILH